ncbi:hypothetical protein ISCGN_026284 [Ixodes scapularis]
MSLQIRREFFRTTSFHQPASRQRIDLHCKIICKRHRSGAPENQLSAQNSKTRSAQNSTTLEALKTLKEPTQTLAVDGEKVQGVDTQTSAQGQETTNSSTLNTDVAKKCSRQKFTQNQCGKHWCNARN